MVVCLLFLPTLSCPPLLRQTPHCGGSSASSPGTHQRLLPILPPSLYHSLPPPPTFILPSFLLSCCSPIDFNFRVYVQVYQYIYLSKWHVEENELYFSTRCPNTLILCTEYIFVFQLIVRFIFYSYFRFLIFSMPVNLYLFTCFYLLIFGEIEEWRGVVGDRERRRERNIDCCST